MQIVKNQIWQHKNKSGEDNAIVIVNLGNSGVSGITVQDLKGERKPYRIKDEDLEKNYKKTNKYLSDYLAQEKRKKKISGQ